MTWLPDLRPRMLLADHPLWPLDTVTVDHRTLYVRVLGGGVLEVETAQLLDDDVDVPLILGGDIVVDDDGRSLHFEPDSDAERPLRVSCLKTWLREPDLVEIALPEGARVVWQKEQVDRLMQRAGVSA